MTLEQQITYWKKASDEAETKSAALVAFGVYAGLSMVNSMESDLSRIVIIESPFAGDMENNRQYAINACADSFRRGEMPFASHLLYPQILNEMKKEERELGIQAGYKFWLLAKCIAFYIDRGWSPGMLRAKERASNLGYIIEERTIERNDNGHQ